MEEVMMKEVVVDDDARSITWYNNHVKIKEAINDLACTLDRLPTQFEIAGHVGLSRRTVCEHMREFKRRQVFIEELEQLEFMSSEIIKSVMQQAAGGDHQAILMAYRWLRELNRMREKVC